MALSDREITQICVRNPLRRIDNEPIPQAARIIRDKMTGIGDQAVWTILKNAHEYLWRQIDWNA